MYRLIFVASVALGLVAFVVVALTSPHAATDPKTAQIKRGEYLVNAGSCNDCHTPWIMTPRGPQPDPTRMLSGHPAEAQVEPIPDAILKSKSWMLLGSMDNTAWAGPWGVSFTANLTPDQVTGTGAWTPEVFIKAMRTGKHMWAGRQILPPMPWYNLAKLSDDDLTAMFAYLQSLKPIANQVPLPIPPATPMK